MAKQESVQKIVTPVFFLLFFSSDLLLSVLSSLSSGGGMYFLVGSWVWIFVVVGCPVELGGLDVPAGVVAGVKVVVLVALFFLFVAMTTTLAAAFSSSWPLDSWTRHISSRHSNRWDDIKRFIAASLKCVRAWDDAKLILIFASDFRFCSWTYYPVGVSSTSLGGTTYLLQTISECWLMKRYMFCKSSLGFSLKSLLSQL